MLVYVIDDEALLARSSERIIRDTVPDAEVKCFLRAADALNEIELMKEAPDVVFSDIQMPGISGLELAVRLRTLCPETKVIFVTGYSEYSLEAWKVHAHGYIMKPLEADRVKEELSILLEKPVKKAKETDDRLSVRCFGNFEVFYHNEPLRFDRRKTKEMLAYLVDKCGRECTPEEISAALWENETDMRLLKNRIRVLVSDLRSTLQKAGQEDVLIRYSGAVAIRCDRIDCDVYRMIEGDMDAVNAFSGEYMKQYSWAELTTGNLYFRFLEKK